MNKLIFALGLLMASTGVMAVDVWKSSSTAVASTGLQTICGAGNRGILHGVCTDFAVASSSMTLYNSSWTVSGVRSIGPIGTTAEGCKYYDTDLPNGISYFKNNTAAVTILYRCQ